MTTDSKVGRPRIEISDEDFAKIVSLAEINATQDEICAIWRISEDTLDRRLKERGYLNFADFYREHGAKGKISLRRLQFKAAEEGNVPMLIWLGKNLLGQSDKQTVTSTHQVTSFEVVASET
jgi:hypothetical protein